MGTSAADLLRAAKANPAAHRDLIVRVAGFADCFCDLSEALHDEIIRRTEHTAFWPGVREWPPGGTLLLAGYQGFRIVAPFLAPLGWAAVFAMVMDSFRGRLARCIGRPRAAATTELATIVVVGSTSDERKHSRGLPGRADALPECGRR